MSSLRSRLARLPPPPSPTLSPTTPRAAPTNVLDELRTRMDAILARSRAEPPRPLPRADVDDLPFCVEETPEGPLHVRTLRLSGAHRVGRAPVAIARSASSELCALLALDPRLAGCDFGGALYLDTETTGLGPGAGTVAFLVGLAWFDDRPKGESVGVRDCTPTDRGLVVEQLLVRQLGEEAPVLHRVAERIRAASMLVTFNGKSFDLPVLRSRFVMGRVPFPDEPPHFDLVHVARRIHKSRRIGATLGAVEREVLGFVRENDVPSGEVSACYLHFLRSGDGRALMGVVEHNAWDVVSMAALVGLYGEPLEGSQLAPVDLVGVARTFKRAGHKDQAFAIADTACARGAGDDGVRARAEIAKARGDKARALADFESLLTSGVDAALRLELTKLYEHHAKDITRALSLAAEGTGEREDRQGARVARLTRKLEKQTRGASTASKSKSNKLW